MFIARAGYTSSGKPSILADLFPCAVAWMSESSLVPERQLVFSPGLAATIGLEEAILLQHLQAQFDHGVPQHRGGFAWLRLERDYLMRSLPFWSAVDLHRVLRSLVDKGVLLVESPPLHSSDTLEFAFNQARRESPASAPPPEPPARRFPLYIHLKSRPQK